jgi:hypothetical protein
MTQEWITDRPPTEADGDGDGDVRLRRCTCPIGWNHAHWSYVALGAPWQHTSFWKPPTEFTSTEPTPTEPDRIAALEQRVAELEIRVLEQMGMMAAHLSRSAAEAFESLRADR